MGNNIKLNLESNAGQKEEVKTKFVEPKMDKLKVSVSSVTNNISNWSLFPEGDGIKAVNNRSMETFIGSVEEFNKKYIRGE